MVDLHYPDIGQTLFSVVNEREQKPVVALEMEANTKQVIAHGFVVVLQCYYLTLNIRTCICIFNVYNLNVLP